MKPTQPSKRPGARIGLLSPAVDRGHLSIRDNNEFIKMRRLAVDREIEARGYVKLDMLEVERRLKGREK